MLISPSPPGILASKLGAHVVLTDLDQATILDNLRRNCASNGAACRVLGLGWDNLSPTAAALRREQPHLLLAADCLYDASKFDEFLSTAAFLLRGRPPGEAALIAVFQERGAGHSLAARVRRWGLCCAALPPAPTAGLRHVRLPPGAAHADGGAELRLLRLHLAGGGGGGGGEEDGGGGEAGGGLGKRRARDRDPAAHGGAPRARSCAAATGGGSAGPAEAS
jgi:hypothetical protein